MQQARTGRRKTLVDCRVAHRHLSDFGRGGQLLQTGMRMLLEAKDQHLHEVGSTELALAHNTARFPRELTRSLFQDELQLLAYICYTGHGKAPFRHESTLVDLCLSCLIKPCFVIPLKLVRIGRPSRSPGTRGAYNIFRNNLQALFSCALDETN